MLLASVVPTLLTLASFTLAANAKSSLEPRPTSPATQSQSPASDISKRDLMCALFGWGCDLANDEYNCGSVGNVCGGNWFNMVGYQCVNGKCGAICKNLWDYNWLTGQCQDVSTDTQNCGKCGQVCSITGASATKCSYGSCIATVCSPGYSLSNGVCNKVIDYTSDPNKCGTSTSNVVCPSTWPNGSGATCQNSVCRATQCNPGYAWDYASRICRLVTSDINNCGSVGNKCSFPNGVGSCSNSVCKLSSCAANYYNVNGVCTYLNLQTDSDNCGTVGKKCTFTNGVGFCSAGVCTFSGCTSTATTAYKLVDNVCQAVNILTDVKNCGAVNNVCPTYSNGGASYCDGGVCKSPCNTGFDFSTSANACVSTASDINNCGKVGNVCSAANGTPQCKLGVCSVASCNTAQGYYLVNGACSALNLSTDIQNCGTVGNVCPTSFANGSGVKCVGGECQASTCVGLYDWSTTLKRCIDVSSDMSNCGGFNKVCSVTNGLGQCSLGICSVKSCNPGFQSIGGKCVQMDITSDVNNCGGVGKVCTFSNGAGVCSNGVCTYRSCVSPYALIQNTCSKVDLWTDKNNCGAVGNVCPNGYANGDVGFCLLGKCQTVCNNLFDFDFLYDFCRDVSSDNNNCGKCGAVCSPTGASAAKCSSGKCIATSCNTGYTLVSGVCTAIDTTSDPKNCGRLGNVCVFAPTGATGVCKASVCTTTGCPSGYSLTFGTCVQNTASQRARLAKKDHIKDKRTLCPVGETACPILGSASFDLALTHHFSAVDEVSGVMAGAGGYECLDTTQSLDSCGGCASTGEGQDCTKIRGAVGVGCDSGSCVVFSCLAGWRPNLAGTKCVRAHTDHAGGHNSSRTAARRHLNARHMSHHHA